MSNKSNGFSDGTALPKNGNFALFFIHGFLDEGSLWSAVVSHLSKNGFDTYAPDLPGMGELAGDLEVRKLPQLASAVIETIDGLAKPVVLVGHSMGAQIAELVAVARPDIIRGLVLISPVPLGGMPVPPEIAGAMRRLGGDPAGQRRLRTQFAPSLDEATLQNLVEVGLKVQPSVVSSLFDAWSEGSPEGAKISKVEAPVLLIGGLGDGFSTPDLLKTAISPRFPAADLVLQDGSGHWPHVEQPEATAAEIDRFLLSLKASNSQG